MAVYDIPPIGPGWQLQALIARYRFSATIEREVVAILEGSYREIAAILMRSGALSLRDRSMLEDRFLEIRQLLSEAYGTAQGRVTPLLREYAALEREVLARQMHAMAAARQAFTAAGLADSPGVLATTVGAPGGVSAVLNSLPRQLVVSTARLTEIVETVDIGGIGFGEWWTAAKSDALARVRRVVQMGVVRGAHPTEIACSIWRASDGAGSFAWKSSRTVAETMARTVVTALQVDAQLASESQFPQVIRGYVFRAVLDSRTSDICRPLADTEWDKNDKRMPRPPLHPNCRSHLEPIVDVPGISRTTSKQPTYEAWLRTQPKNVQDMVLGKGIAQTWRGNQVKLSELITTDRRPLSLAQLRTQLITGSRESFAGWLQSLPSDAQRAVLGPSLSRQLRDGTASLDEILDAAARSGVVPPRTP